MVDINCEEGEQWQDHKNGVVKMIIPIGTSSFLCTGAILNNTKEDLKPYLLTAFHCLLSSKEQASCGPICLRPNSFSDMKIRHAGAIPPHLRYR